MKQPLPKDGPFPQVILGKDAESGWLETKDEKSTYWQRFLKNSPETLAANFGVIPGIVLGAGPRAWPLTVEGGNTVSSYPCSLLTQYVRYPIEELSLIQSPFGRVAARAGLEMLGACLRAGSVDQVVQWSSWLLSTNLHDNALTHDAPAVTAALVHKFPRHAILLKNINAQENPILPLKLRECGYELITSRQIYFFDGRSADFMKRSDVKKDLKALDSLTDHTPVSHRMITVEDASRITELYEMLYLEKHSRLNPVYTKKFVEHAISDGWLEFYGLRHISGRLDGVFGCFKRGGVASTPFIGYDTTQPACRGFYRLLVAMLLRATAENGWLLNYSSGAGEFKRRRGAVAAWEWNALYVRHLPLQRRWPYSLLRLLMNVVGRRFLEANGI